MTNQMHIERVSKLSLTQINSVLSNISEDGGEWDPEYLTSYLLNGWFSKYDTKEWNSEVKRLTEWFGDSNEWFETKQDFEYVCAKIKAGIFVA
jgi:hypothetical protein|tara:strand:- start:95 stop:373 length:279 start_codon:yes stop_codon:yes gene_type:complete